SQSHLSGGSWNLHIRGHPRLPLSIHGPLRQPGEVPSSLPGGHLRDWLLQETSGTLLFPCQGILSWAVQANCLSLLNPPVEGERAAPTLLHAEKIFSDVIPKCEKCQSVVKPDIIFFGENLPARFFSCMQSDFQKVDLLIIMGTSLQVQPFASLISKAPLSTPRLLINKEKTGQRDPFLGMMMGLGGSMDFDSKKAYRDVAWLGDCDQGCLALADLLGWKKELEDLVRKEHASIDAQSGSGAPNPTTSTSPRKSPPPAKEVARTTTEGEKPQ
ncbi:NAD-dependent protein deacetylase sirtuin-2 isoform 2, partial [Daubentonia madagascariensis]